MLSYDQRHWPHCHCRQHNNQHYDNNDHSHDNNDDDPNHNDDGDDDK